MPRILRVLLLSGIPLLTPTLLVDAAESIQSKFQGVWATAGLPCDKLFTKKHGEISFVRFYGAKAPGLIVKGDRVEGPQANCKFLSVKENASALTATLDCRQEIIFDKLVVHVRFISDDEFVRFDPTVPEIETNYHRCRL